MNTNPDPDPLSYYETELPAVIRGVRNGEKWEVFYGRWEAPQETLEYYIRNSRKIRLAPKPTLRPWTFETRPEGMIWVHNKDQSYFSRLITVWGPGSVELAGYGRVTYDELFTDWLQRDGKPCGTEEGGSK